MAILDGYLNQTATLLVNSGYNDYGEPQTTSESMECRYQDETKLMLDRYGREFVSQAKVFSYRELKPDDEITFDGRTFPIKQVQKKFELDGTFSHYESYT